MLEAASRVFGERGYTGATTDAVALAAGVSQAYVVRTFGSKKALFAEVAQRAHERTEEAFRSAAAQEAEAQAPLDDRLGLAYVRLMHQPGVLRTVSHLFGMGHDPHFGPMARDGFLSIYRLLRFEIRLSQQRTRAFLAHGMLINTILSLRLPDLAGTDDDATALLSGIFRETFDDVVAAAAEHDPLPEGHRSAEPGA